MAEFKYSTEKLGKDIHEKLKPILNKKQILFDYKFNRLERDIKNLESGNSDLKNMLFLFERNYKKELNLKYDEKKSLYEEKDDLYERNNKLGEELKISFIEKDEAYQRVNSSQEDVDSWHAKSQRSTLLFGNKGKKLPKHSFFGQSYGDLDGYKYERDEAYEDVQECKDEIGRLKTDQHSNWSKINQIKDRIHILKAEINDTKHDRQNMFDLKKKGITNDKLRKKIDINSNNVNEQKSMLVDIDAQRDDFLRTSRQRAGIDKLEDEVESIKKEKTEFIDEFDKDYSIDLRKKKHREEWLKENRSVKT